MAPCTSREFDLLLTTWRVAPGFQPRRRGTTLEYWVGPHLVAKVEKDGRRARLFRLEDLSPLGDYMRKANAGRYRPSVNLQGYEAP